MRFKLKVHAEHAEHADIKLENVMQPEYADAQGATTPEPVPASRRPFSGLFCVFCRQDTTSTP